MHIVTKILVIFGALFAVLLAALTVAFSTNADRLKEAVQNEQAKVILLEANLRSSEGTKAAELLAAQEQIKQATEARDQIKTQIAALQAERSKLQQNLSMAEMDKQGTKNQVDTLSAATRTSAQTLQSLTDEVNNLRSALVSASKRENELVDRLNDEEARRIVLEQGSRALQEQLQEAKIAIERVKSGVTDTKGEPFVDRSGPIVKARIRRVMPSPAGGELAEINEGSNLNLRPNQQLSIVRNGNFVATIVLVTVDSQASIGRIDKLGKDVTILPEDEVLSRVN